jgi:hypothetical protein
MPGLRLPMIRDLHSEACTSEKNGVGRQADAVLH